MLSSAVRTFTDPDDYASSIRASSTSMEVLDRGKFTAEITRIDMHHLWMQRFSENLPRIMHSTNVSGRAVFVFLTQPGPSLHRGGAELGPTCGQPVQIRHPRPDFARNHAHRRADGLSADAPHTALAARATQAEAVSSLEKSVAPDEVGSFIAIDGEGMVTIYSGKVELGTGVLTAITQIAAEEREWKKPGADTGGHPRPTLTIRTNEAQRDRQN